MRTSHYRVLLVEDCVADALLAVRQLEHGGLPVEYERVETAAQMQAALKAKTWDFILSDFHLPRFDALAALALHTESGLDIPFIVVSGLIGEEQAVKLIKAGAHDYVMKDQMEKLVPAVKRELQAAEERCIRRRSQSTEAFIVSLVQSCDDAIIGQTLEGNIVSWNEAAERTYGYTASEILGSSSSMLAPSYRPPDQTEILEKIRRGEAVVHFETVHLHKDRTPVEVSLTVSPVRDSRGRIVGASTVAQDITHQKVEEAERLGLIQELTSALAAAANTEAKDANSLLAPPGNSESPPDPEELTRHSHTRPVAEDCSSEAGT